MMFSHRSLNVLYIFLFARSLAYSPPKCGRNCVRNATIATYGNLPEDNYYYNIIVVIKKLSGVLIMLLLFAVGYFVHRMLCSRSRQSASPQNRPPPVTTSQELLMERCAPDGLVGPAHVPQLPRYDECKLPTYEETMRDGSRGLPAPSMGPASRRGFDKTEWDPNHLYSTG